MWLIGQVSQEEIEVMEEQGWDVEEVDKTHFNKSLDPHYNPEEDADINDHDGEKLVAVFIDNDMSKQLTTWHLEQMALNKRIQEARLEKARREKLQELYETVLEMPEDMPILETEDVCIDEDHYIQNFYYENPIAGEDCVQGTFHVYFEKGTAKVIEYRPGDGVPLP